MKFSTSLAGALMLASSVLATPLSPAKVSAIEKLRAKRALTRQSNVMNLTAGSDLYAATVSSTNWAGAALVETGVTEVSGVFTVPKPSIPSGGSSNTQYCGAAWVGIDGYSNDDLIQTGVLWCIEGTSYEYEAWYEYLPASLVAYSGITVTAGSVVTVTATKTGTNSGTTTLSAGGVTVSHTFSNQDYPLPGASAEWIVEDFTEGSSLVPLANWGTVTFTDATAVVNGATVEATGSNIIVLESSSGATESSTTVSGETVTVKYV